MTRELLALDEKKKLPPDELKQATAYFNTVEKRISPANINLISMNHALNEFRAQTFFRNLPLGLAQQWIEHIGLIPGQATIVAGLFQQGFAIEEIEKNFGVAEEAIQTIQEHQQVQDRQIANLLETTAARTDDDQVLQTIRETKIFGITIRKKTSWV